ncbi:g protein-coupled receptor [Anaeramoeba ignava]|uniref:G protein-coupled receptor n=1 Tax=Anaeramoeba ignava TaxID=1746090 RepID=A0A9Q0L5T1_ANAIG|nr:g protein-coupled receptor [Anaeramoeba ignava]
MSFQIFFPDLVGAFLGVLGSIIIIFVHFKFPELRTFYRKLVFVLSIYDLFSALVYTLPGHYVHGICVFQPAIIACFVPMTGYWNAAISIITTLKITRNVSDQILNRTYWCWVKEIYLTELHYFVWWSFLFISLIFYFYTVFKIRVVFQEISRLQNFVVKEQSQKNLETQIRMSLIPIVYILIIIPTSVKRGREMFQKNPKDYPALDFLQALFLSTQGFFDCIIFVFTVKKVRTRLFSLFSKSDSIAVIEREPLIQVMNESYDAHDKLGSDEEFKLSHLEK